MLDILEYPENERSVGVKDAAIGEGASRGDGDAEVDCGSSTTSVVKKRLILLSLSNGDLTEGAMDADTPIFSFQAARGTTPVLTRSMS